jgi:ribosomal protein L30/L7E
MSDKKTLTVQLVKSIAGTRESHRATVRGLGLSKLNSTYTPTVSESRATALSWFSGGNAAGGGFAGGIRGFQLSNGILLPNAMLVSDADQTNASVTGDNPPCVALLHAMSDHRFSNDPLGETANRD